MKIRNNKFFITLLLIIVLLAWYFTKFPQKSLDLFDGKEEGNLYYSSSLDVSIDSVSNDINFYVKDGIDQVEYSLNGSTREKLVVNESGTKLKLSVKVPSFNWFGFGSGSLEITVPTSFVFDKLEVSSVSGDIICDELKAEELLSFKCLSGNIFFNNLIAKQIKLATTSGNIDGSTALCSILNIKSLSGEIDLAKVQAPNEDVLELTAKSISGNCDILDIGSFKSCNISTSSGNIDCYFSVPVGLIAQSMSGNIYINGKIQNVDVNNINTDENYLVKASTASGNISINY